MERFMEFLSKSVNCFTAVLNLKEMLENAGFVCLPAYEPWRVESGGKYYMTYGDSAIFAFVLPEDLQAVRDPMFRMISAHTDYPCFRIKPCPEMRTNGYRKLNAEVYGGPIFSTWLDRPLSLAGRVTLTGEDPFRLRVEYVDLKKPVLVIPNLAIHMNRGVNAGVELNPQVDMLPVGGLVSGLEQENEDLVLAALCEAVGCKADEILDFDLFTYVTEKPELVGFKEEFLSSPRLDDLVMAHTAVSALTESSPVSGINVFLGFDHEEIGSRTSTGAGSQTVMFAMEKMAMALGLERSAFLDKISRSFLISADVAHAIHPAHPERHDPVLKTQLGGGPAIKMAAKQSYVTQSSDYSVYEAVCKKAGVPVQKFTNKSDAAGGSTLGPVVVANMPCRVMDMGVPILSMHSSREMMAVADYDYTKRSFITYYSL
ncbi:MAG: M18 family aminopeptidase [Lachnospiraceae bacterium]|nr:M18 family aminopeptidase [Lachnospiraceae bacterium]